MKYEGEDFTSSPNIYEYVIDSRGDLTFWSDVDCDVDRSNSNIGVVDHGTDVI